uniref:tRNA-dihydrouridine(20a/20b) synthase [NAD(P)+]-like (Trinotate prediction) n=1 Tax=Henneguya salminicola TaxID=69463 RepID=A0A6G3MG57_HENSL
MCARSLLKNPTFYTGCPSTPIKCIEEYIILAKKYQTKLSYMKNHIIFMTSDCMSKQEKNCISVLKNSKDIINFIANKYNIKKMVLDHLIQEPEEILDISSILTTKLKI